MSVIDLLKTERPHTSLVPGVVTGIVTNNQDPDSLGRVKVKIPRLSGDNESAWARVVSFMAGNGRGAVFLPEVDDEVLIAFEFGDLSMPYVIGGVWNGQDAPPQLNSDGENNIRIIKSRSGHVVKLNDKDGEETIEIIDKSEANSIVIATADNKITITADADIEIKCPNGKFSVDANEIEMKTAAATKLKADGNVNVETSATMTLKGSQVNIN